MCTHISFYTSMRYTHRIVAILSLAGLLPGCNDANDEQINAKHRRLEVCAKEGLVILVILVEKLSEISA